MRKYDFVWMLPACMLAIVVAMGGLLLSAAGLISIVPPDAASLPVVATDSTQVQLLDSTQLAATPVPIDSVTLAASIQGKSIFESNCAQCHAINEVVVGPALRNVHKRRSIAWLVPWVKNSSKMVAAGDEYGVKIFNLYQKQQMPSFQLSETEIKNILAYIEVESGITGAGTVAVR
ncbi:c-type cytochrome [Hymenobacter cellulosivorans]|uniref:Cytochrome c n=1 Tax=Hymenobacter cellulosivorans TaxID=2932249 RepID=A0ABY4F8X1_9BACT|nr:cytochrome c [Hymenobacter cellulosivorans]UOQ50921.1 cytochrome c [Hymenobacter cellulosivorans]